MVAHGSGDRCLDLVARPRLRYPAGNPIEHPHDRDDVENRPDHEHEAQNGVVGHDSRCRPQNPYAEQEWRRERDPSPNPGTRCDSSPGEEADHEEGDESTAHEDQERHIHRSSLLWDRSDINGARHDRLIVSPREAP